MTTSKDISQLNFLTFKNRGHTYVRAYRNVWVPKKVDEKGNVIKKAGSAPAEQHQVGALLPSGRVKVSRNFLEKFPVFEGIDWYFLARQLVDEETYYAKAPDPIEQASQQTAEAATDDDQTQQPEFGDEKEDTVVSGPEVKNFLPYFALATLAQQNGLMDALTAIFGKDDAIRWRDYAIYQVLRGGSADCFEYWAMDQYLPKISSKMDGFGTRLRRTGALSKDLQVNRAYRDRRALFYQLLAAAQAHCAKTRRGGSRSLVHREPPALGAGYAFRPGSNASL